MYAVQLAQPRLDIPAGLAVHCFMQQISRGYTWIKDRIRIMKDTAETLDRLKRRSLIYQSPPSSMMESGWSTYEHLLDQMAADAAAQQAKIAFVTVAAGEQVYPAFFARELSSLGFRSQDYDVDYPNQRTADTCQRQKLVCWFLLPAFEAASKTVSQQLFDYYDPNDSQRSQNYPGHYTPIGYTLAAKTIGQYILDAHWIGN
jgi:hypothetical protein